MVDRGVAYWGGVVGVGGMIATMNPNILDLDESKEAEIRAIFGGDPPESARDALQRFVDRNELHHLWAIYDTLRQIPISTAHRLAFISIRLLFEDDEAQGEGIDYVGEFIEAIHASAHSTKKIPIDVSLRASYRLVHNRLASWDAAVDLASYQLQTPINRGTWRRRVTRWAERAALPPVEHPRGRPRKNDTVTKIFQ